MKSQAVIVLLAIALTIAIPPSFSLTCGDAGHAMIGTLDICHSATPALSSSGSMPCIQQCPCNPLPLALQGTSQIVNLRFKPVITAFDDERPPKV
jgi:hypothetical protein